MTGQRVTCRSVPEWKAWVAQKTNWPILVVIGVLGLLLVVEEMRFGFGRFVYHVETIGLREHIGRKPFDSAKWQSPTAADGDYSIRCRMVDNLLSKHRLTEMSRKRITKLLGRPDIVFGNQYQYALDMERGWLKVDYEALEITFGPSGRVVKAETSVH